MDVIHGIRGADEVIAFVSDLVHDDSPEVSRPAVQVAEALAARYLKQRCHVAALKLALLSGNSDLITQVTEAGRTAHPKGTVRRELDGVTAKRQQTTMAAAATMPT